MTPTGKGPRYSYDKIYEIEAIEYSAETPEAVIQKVEAAKVLENWARVASWHLPDADVAKLLEDAAKLVHAGRHL